MRTGKPNRLKLRHLLPQNFFRLLGRASNWAATSSIPTKRNRPRIRHRGAGPPAMAILSHEFWRAHYGARSRT